MDSLRPIHILSPVKIPESDGVPVDYIDIQAAVDDSEDMQAAIKEFELRTDLFMVIGVSCFASVPSPHH